MRRRDRGDEHDPGDPLDPRGDASAAQGAEPRRDQLDDVAPEVRGHGDERAQVQRDVECLVEGVVLLQVRPVEEPRDEDQVARRRDREQLRRPLHEAEHERLPVRELRRIVPHSGCGEHEGERRSAAPATARTTARRTRPSYRIEQARPGVKEIVAQIAAMRWHGALDRFPPPLGSPLHRARSASRSKLSAEAVRGSGRST